MAIKGVGRFYKNAGKNHIITLQTVRPAPPLARLFRLVFCGARPCAAASS